MSSARRPAGGHDDGDTRGQAVWVIGALVLAVAVVTALVVSGQFAALQIGRQPPASAPAPEAPVIITGTGNQITDSFHLAGGTYRGAWSAWGEAAEFPPCTHSAELMAVDPANGYTSSGEVTDLASLVDVPATGASDESYVYNVKPGDYYVDVTSACAWQIALSPG